MQDARVIYVSCLHIGCDGCGSPNEPIAVGSSFSCIYQTINQKFKTDEAMGYNCQQIKMKKLLFTLSIVAMTLGFSSCQQKNQPENPQTEDPQEVSLVGDWAATAISNYQVDGPSEVLIGTATITDDSYKYLSFEANGTGLMKVENDLISFSWKKLSKQLMLYQGSELFITYDITSLTRNMLILSEYDPSRTNRVATTYERR